MQHNALMPTPDSPRGRDSCLQMPAAHAALTPSPSQLLLCQAHRHAVQVVLLPGGRGAGQGAEDEHHQRGAGQLPLSLARLPERGQLRPQVLVPGAHRVEQVSLPDLLAWLVQQS